MMETVKNTSYFEEQLMLMVNESTDSSIRQLINDMIEYAELLEASNNKIPPVKNRPHKPKPDGKQSEQFSVIIMDLPSTIDPCIQSLLIEFLSYLKELENRIN